ncbi:MAG: sulfotransferase, partial [Desulfobulbaceae bacterium]|nr:sulfotransferase [Desulfobulbaceae bacterium]
QFDEQQKIDLLTGLFENYYKGVPQDKVVFDTNRSWSARMGLLQQLFPDSKVVCCVRNVAWVMDSFERLVQRYPLIYSRLFNDDGERATVYSRTEALGRRNRVVGYSVAALREAFYGQYSSSLLLVDYDLLSQYPEKCLRLVYDFLGEKHFEHDVENVEFEDSEFDRQLGLPEMHTVQRVVSFKE